MKIKIHCSLHENMGWIRIDKLKPPINKKVRFCRVIFHDFNLESMKWETTGWMTNRETLSVKYNDKMSNKYELPTHWKDIN